MKFYRKKPVVIQAVQWTGDNIVDILNFCDKGYFKLTDGKEQLHKIYLLRNQSDNILLNNISRFKNRLHCWE